MHQTIEWVIRSVIHNELRNGISSQGFIHQNMLGKWCCHHIIQVASLCLPKATHSITHVGARLLKIGAESALLQLPHGATSFVVGCKDLNTLGTGVPVESVVRLIYVFND